MENKFDDEKILDEYLYKTVPTAAQEMVDETEISNDIHVSEEFDKRMKKYFDKLDRKAKFKRFHVYAKRACVLIIAVVVVAGASVMSVDAWRIKLFNMLTNKSETNTEIKFQNEGENKYVSDEITLNYLPVGFQLLEDNKLAAEIYLSFTNREQVIQIVCRPIQSTVKLDTEDADSKSIKINESDAILTQKNGVYSIIWSDGLYSYSVTGDITEDELIKIARNVERERV